MHAEVRGRLCDRVRVGDVLLHVRDDLPHQPGEMLRERCVRGYGVGAGEVLLAVKRGRALDESPITTGDVVHVRAGLDRRQPRAHKPSAHHIRLAPGRHDEDLNDAIPFRRAVRQKVAQQVLVEVFGARANAHLALRVDDAHRADVDRDHVDLAVEVQLGRLGVGLVEESRDDLLRVGGRGLLDDAAAPG